jgi:hypothetical protein
MGPTVTVTPVSTYFGAPPELYPMREQSNRDFVTRTERSMARSTPRTASWGLQAPAVDPTKSVDALPTLLNQPRKLSSGSTASTVSRESFESRPSYDSRTRSSSWSSKTSFESTDFKANNWRPEYMYNRPGPIARQRIMKRREPGELFAALPGEVLELILDELKKLHLDQGISSNGCATCWMRDLCNIGLSARKWFKFARASLYVNDPLLAGCRANSLSLSRYEDIQLVGADSAVHKKRYKLSHGTRLVLLRRTLRASPQVAAIVRSLKVPAPPQGVSLEEYHNLVASVIMACPNLERLVGMYPNYNHSFSRLFHALSSRQRLKDMVWMVEASPFQRQHRIRSSSGSASAIPLPLPQPGKFLTPGDLQPHQSAAFLDHHVNWAYLTTLSVHCRPGATLSPDSLMTTTISYLPALQNLYLSHLPVTAFNDNNLVRLPALRKLSLSHMPGISSVGLSALATTVTSQSLKVLTLCHVNIDSLPALARILSNCARLETLSLVQSFAPILPEDTFIWLMPYLASSSLRKLHWDITSHPSCANAADSILGRSIGAGGFPSLRTLRTPNDPEGLFQALCKPLERADASSDRYVGLGPGSGMYRPSTPGSPTKLPANSPSSPMFPPDASGTRECSDLHQSRLAAQARLEAARRFPRYFVNVIDEDGRLCEKFGIAGFIGTVESRINYYLRPDPGATDEKGGLVSVVDLLGDGGEDLGARGGCSGKWNATNGPSDKKDKERWWHTERGRWKGLEVS